MTDQPWAKVMFEIYQETGYDGLYRVVYFSELNERNKEWEINRAMSGRHVYDGFILERRKEEAKRVIAGLLDRLNAGELDAEGAVAELEEALGESVA